MSPIWNFTEIRLVGAALIRKDVQTDGLDEANRLNFVRSVRFNCLRNTDAVLPVGNIIQIIFSFQGINGVCGGPR